MESLKKFLHKQQPPTIGSIEINNDHVNDDDNLLPTDQDMSRSSLKLYNIVLKLDIAVKLIKWSD